MFAYIADAAALVIFICSWLGYTTYVRRRHRTRPGLNALMVQRRHAWMTEMSRREVRIVDTAIMGTLQNGTAFFASTSLIAIGGAATLLRSTDDVLRVFADLPFALPVSRGMWEAKVIGLLVIYGYAFFKFAWSYRLFNYAAILIGATPPASSPDAEGRAKAAAAAARMNSVAAGHFVSGQRALFVSFAYLGWFLGPVVFIITTALIMVVIFRRQFDSDALAALADDTPTDAA
ncbi:MAG: DUF599 family protein [Beijerinckiaceae bacterium]